uniref:SUN domain-containing protein n=1 Tax=Paramormyrops kingsleyae TaxID=1676925 RepID=A0A3B3RG29_9TELE|nr:SUN domain-containing protein 1-like isoform X2 [Paramormyrops kingsleyae]
MRVPSCRGGRQDRAPGSELNLQGVSRRAVETWQPCQRSPPLRNTGHTSLRSSYEGEPRAAAFRSPSMSRRSLRLHTPGGRYGDDSLADLSLSYCGETRTVRSRKEQQHQSSQSVLLMPHRSLPGSALHTQGSVHSCAASNASLLSSLLDESCVQERTLFDSFWGEDDDVEIRDRGLLDQPDIHTAQTQTSMLIGHFGDDCAVQRERQDILSAHSPSLHSAHTHEDTAASAPGPPASTLYCRKHKPGVLASSSDACLRRGRWLAVSAASVLTLLVQTVLLKVQTEGKGVLGSLCRASLWYSKSAAASAVSLASRLASRLAWGAELKAPRHGAIAQEGGDDCKGKQQPVTHIPVTRSPVVTRLVEALWCIVVNAGYVLLCVLWTATWAAYILTRLVLSVLWFTVRSPGSAASGLLRWLGVGWYQLIALMSLLDVFILTWCLPKLYRLMLLLLPLLLILGLWQRDSYSLLVLEAPRQEEKVSVGGGHTADGRADAGRLGLLENHISQLWESVRRGGWQSRRRQERLQTQGQDLDRQRTLLEQLERRTDPAALGSWVSELLEQKLGSLREELSSRELGEQLRTERPTLQQRNTASRLTHLEALLRNLEAKTEDVLQRQVSVTPPPVSAPVSTDSEAHHSLLEKVQRLEVELGRLRQDLQGALEAQERCEQLETLQNGVSAQVKQELRMLFYGSEGAARADVPVPLLPWLSAHFTRGSDLRGALSALEHSILKNVSLWVEQSERPPCVQTASCAVAGGQGTAGVSKEEVQQIVQNALRLYSQDQTGLVDYALESGGGSILGTRCSETYETRSALMSLFGLPLWYFTQSPRVVIQPDVHPGNCWPFKGSKGFLVIRLSRKIIPTAFSLEHLAKALSPLGNLSSAPRHFEVYGLENELQDEGILLGKYTYEEDGESLQTFLTSEQIEQAFQIIELQVLSNWGHPDYTCLYRFRVHGEPSAQ